MLLKLIDNNHLVAIRDINELVNPYARTVRARLQWGEEEQEPESFAKEELCFPSGEPLPRCWRDEHYRDHEVERHHTQRALAGG